jgi:hypothetical protein
MMSLRLVHHSHPTFTAKHITTTGLHSGHHPSVITLKTLARLDDKIPVYVVRDLRRTKDVTLPRAQYRRVYSAVEQKPLPEVGT